MKFLVLFLYLIYSASNAYSNSLDKGTFFNEILPELASNVAGGNEGNLSVKNAFKVFINNYDHYKKDKKFQNKFLERVDRYLLTYGSIYGRDGGFKETIDFAYNYALERADEGRLAGRSYDSFLKLITDYTVKSEKHIRRFYIPSDDYSISVHDLIQPKASHSQMYAKYDYIKHGIAKYLQKDHLVKIRKYVKSLKAISLFYEKQVNYKKYTENFNIFESDTDFEKRVKSLVNDDFFSHAFYKDFFDFILSNSAEIINDKEKLNYSFDMMFEYSMATRSSYTRTIFFKEIERLFKLKNDGEISGKVFSIYLNKSKEVSMRDITLFKTLYIWYYQNQPMFFEGVAGKTYGFKFDQADIQSILKFYDKEFDSDILKLILLNIDLDNNQYDLNFKLMNTSFVSLAPETLKKTIDRFVSETNIHQLLKALHNENIQYAEDFYSHAYGNIDKATYYWTKHNVEIFNILFSKYINQPEEKIIEKAHYKALKSLYLKLVMRRPLKVYRELSSGFARLRSGYYVDGLKTLFFLSYRIVSHPFYKKLRTDTEYFKEFEYLNYNGYLRTNNSLDIFRNRVTPRYFQHIEEVHKLSEQEELMKAKFTDPSCSLLLNFVSSR